MSSNFRYRGGDVRPALFKTNANYPIQAGDLLFMDTDGTVKPAAAAGSSGAFVAGFAGIAMSNSGVLSGEWSPTRTTDVGYVPVATAGDYEFDCPSQRFDVGALVGPYVPTGGTRQNQAVTLATSAELAIGVAIPGVYSLQNAMSRIVVRIKSVVVDGGVQPPYTPPE